MKNKKYFVSLLIIFLLGCHGPDSHNASRQERGAGGRDWSYEGETGPEHWGELSPRYSLCKDGKEQSPIDIAGPFNEAAPDLSFGYNEIPLTLINRGYTLEIITAPGGGWLQAAGKSFDLIEFHFHYRSEHKVEGKDYEMAVHFVHQNSAKQLAIVGVFMTVGESNPLIQTLLDNLPEQQGKTAAIEGVAIDPTQLLPEERGYFSYAGSLTTPGCSEDVPWHVMMTPIEVSVEQIAAFAVEYGYNSRPVQPLGDRIINRHQ